MHSIGSGLVLFGANPTAWLTPVWLLGVGLLIGLVVLAILYGIARLAVPKAAAYAADALHEGFLFPLLVVAAIFGAFALLSLLLTAAGVGYLPLSDIGRSMSRLAKSDEFQTDFTVPGVPKEERVGKPIEYSLNYRPEEMRSVSIGSDKD